MKRPSIKSPCVADRGAVSGERIAEITFPDGTGALLSLREGSGGRPGRIEVYRADAGLRIVTPRLTRAKRVLQ